MKFKNKKNNQVIEVLTPNLIEAYKNNKDYKIVENKEENKEDKSEQNTQSNNKK